MAVPAGPGDWEELSDHFEEHLEREKAMHQQCHDILSTLSSILQEHRVTKLKD